MTPSPEHLKAAEALLDGDEYTACRALDRLGHIAVDRAMTPLKEIGRTHRTRLGENPYAPGQVRPSDAERQAARIVARRNLVAAVAADLAIDADQLAARQARETPEGIARMERANLFDNAARSVTQFDPKLEATLCRLLAQRADLVEAGEETDSADRKLLRLVGQPHPDCVQPEPVDAARKFRGRK